VATEKKPTQGERIAVLEEKCEDIADIKQDMRETRETVVGMKAFLENGLGQRIASFLAAEGKKRNGSRKMALAVIGTVLTTASVTFGIVQAFL